MEDVSRELENAGQYRFLGRVNRLYCGNCGNIIELSVNIAGGSFPFSGNSPPVRFI